MAGVAPNLAKFNADPLRSNIREIVVNFASNASLGAGSPVIVPGVCFTRSTVIEQIMATLGVVSSVNDVTFSLWRWPNAPTSTFDDLAETIALGSGNTYRLTAAMKLDGDASTLGAALNTLSALTLYDSNADGTPDNNLFDSGDRCILDTSADPTAAADLTLIFRVRDAVIAGR